MPFCIWRDARYVCCGMPSSSAVHLSTQLSLGHMHEASHNYSIPHPGSQLSLTARRIGSYSYVLCVSRWRRFVLVHGVNHGAGAVAGAITLLHNVLQVSTCFLKDREVCFANNLFYMVFGISTRSRGRCAGSDHVGGGRGRGLNDPWRTNEPFERSQPLST